MSDRKPKPQDFTVFGEAAELARAKELSRWAEEEERKRQTAGTPRPPLFSKREEKP
jgi:hypothetical protein